MAAQGAPTCPFAALSRPNVLHREAYADVQPSAGWPTQAQLPYVYHEAYNVTIFGIEKLHPFDSCKFGKVVDILKAQGLLNFPSQPDGQKTKQASQIVEPRMLTSEGLADVHTAEYLKQIHSSNLKVVQVTELPPLLMVPTPLLQWKVVEPMHYHAAGTILAAGLAVERGWAMQLGGGMHHASSNDGLGWCMFDDIYLAVKRLRTATNGAIKKVLLIDCDAHQGNGVGRDKLKFKDEDLFILDVFNSGIFPRDDVAIPAINIPVRLRSGTGDDVYLGALRRALDQATEDCPNPDLVFFNAGTDVLAGDPLGRLEVSSEAIRQRDHMVWDYALNVARAPIVLTLSGGYAPQSSQVISASLANLIRTYNLNAMPS